MRKNRRVGYKWALSLSWPIRYAYFDHVTFSNKSSVCTGETSLPCLLVFVKITVAVWILKKAVGFGIAEEVILNFVKSIS